MNDLQIFDYDGKLYADSREVAEMVGKRHDHLVRDIDRYVEVIGHSSKLRADDSNVPNFGAVDFFAKSTYQDAKGEIRRCYLITKKGCEFVANKLTGEKGILFTAEYITAFHSMEDKLLTPSKEFSFLPKASSVGEGASVLKLVDKIMVAQKASGYERAIAFKQAAEKLHIPVPDNFIQPRPFEQTVLMCVSTIKV
ncbi:Rha family transcriptional regulator [Caproiciproducens galactitolivorans]|uniref:Rha family transcriptional regulator n=1 Tax=Caproiciproducens galactitolivorans TaxID=642589 RepID=A0ABT4BUX5_9FIRM|nr:Rha family transcriptional regulator [Caproiciproducens galactitolivorans]MCY1713726.1 Rha family transcriptional regulator [Caproiciproducens galactitolivorans]